MQQKAGAHDDAVFRQANRRAELTAFNLRGLQMVREAGECTRCNAAQFACKVGT